MEKKWLFSSFSSMCANVELVLERKNSFLQLCRLFIDVEQNKTKMAAIELIATELRFMSFEGQWPPGTPSHAHRKVNFLIDNKPIDTNPKNESKSFDALGSIATGCASDVILNSIINNWYNNNNNNNNNNKKINKMAAFQMNDGATVQCPVEYAATATCWQR